MTLRSMGSVLGAALWFVALWGCGSSNDVTCGTGTELIGGKCVPAADAGTTGDAGPDAAMTVTCGDHTVMIDGMCKGLLPIGAACTRGAECESSTCLPESDGFVGGYCSTPMCNDLRPCSAGAACYYSAKKDKSICLAYCDTSADCRDNYACQPIYGTDQKVCAPSCKVSDTCPDQTVCNQDTGVCDLRDCDPAAKDPCDTANSGRTCVVDPKKTSAHGGLCLTICDPKDPTAKCQTGDVCQPLPNDPANTGVCAPPLCTTNADCNAGAVCMNKVCQPPARCDDNGNCADSNTACVGGKGGQCMPKCPSSGSCTDIHADLACATGIAASPVCLPVGSYPGSACRSDKNSPCDSVAAGNGTAAMVCENSMCLVGCKTGGDTLCSSVSDTLACASGIYDQPVCLPKGTYPGSACGGANHDQCSDVTLSGGATAKQLCEGGVCVFDCGSSVVSDSDPAKHEAYCSGIDSTLSCATDIFPNASVCLPQGTFPGGACSHGQCGSLNGTAMACENNMCLVTCSTSSDHCADVDPSLVCAGGIYDKSVCLPKGAFPGGPCDSNNQCAQNLNGVDELDMQCVSGVCAIGCSETGKWSGYGDALCQFANPALTCASAAGSICVEACQTGSCTGANTACFDAGAVPAHENACLPYGTFPGAPCASGNTCAAGPGGTTMSCVDGTCAVQCPSGSNGDTLCATIDASLTCSDAGGGYCVLACNASYNATTHCPENFSCLTTSGENTCLPNGSFPGAACGANNSCGAGPGGTTMACVNGTCAVQCPSGSAGDTLCSTIDASLTCSDAGGGYCVLACNAAYNATTHCPDGFSCLATSGENTCLPNGSFPGAACGASNSCGAGPGGTTMGCLNGTCAVQCPSGGSGDTLCSAVDASLTCSDAAGGYCVLACNAAYNSTTHCPSGYSCLGTTGENTCLPNGSFPGAACDSNNACTGTTPPLVCVANTQCAANCDDAIWQATQAPDANTYCAAIDPSLSCVTAGATKYCSP